MSYDKWSALLPFYVAGTLPPAEKEAFERFLAQSPQARQALEEWRIVAHHVYLEASQRAPHLPPLRTSVRQAMHTSAHTNNGRSAVSDPMIPLWSSKGATPPKRGALHKPSSKGRLVMAALAALVLLTCIGALALLTFFGNDEAEVGAIQRRTIAAQSATPTASATPIGTSTTVPLMIPATNIPNPSEVGSVVPSLVPMITNTPQPFEVGSLVPSLVPPGLSPASTEMVFLTTLGTPTPFPTGPAPLDETLTIALDSTLSQQRTGEISFPEGDTSDEILLVMPSDVPARELILRVSCIGIAPEYAQWRVNDSPPFACTNESSTTVTLNANQVATLIVEFTPDSPPNVVHYSLFINLPDDPNAAPQVALPDADLLTVQMQQYLPQQFSQEISSPTGDPQDSFEISLGMRGDGPPSYTYRLTLSCVGQNTANLIWAHGLERQTYRCGDSVQTDFFRRSDNYKFGLNVLFQDPTQISYAYYTVTLQYIYEVNESFPGDAEPKELIVTQAGTSFSNTLSASNWIDRLHVTVTDIAADETRGLVFTLQCSGSGSQQVTWTTLTGGKTNGCGSTLSASLTAQNNQISFDITIPEGSTAEASYTLLVE